MANGATVTSILGEDHDFESCSEVNFISWSYHFYAE